MSAVVILLLETDSRHEARIRACHIEGLLAGADYATQQRVQSIGLIALRIADASREQRSIVENPCRDLRGLAGNTEGVLRNRATCVQPQHAEKLQHRAETERVLN